jgi:hypothetical protein
VSLYTCSLCSVLLLLSVIMLSATNLNIIILSVTMVSAFIHMFFVLSAFSECHNAE